MSNWNIFITCEKCGEDIDPDDVIEIDGRKLCPKCAEEVRLSQKMECRRCHNTFPRSELKLYRGNLYCEKCLSEIKAERKKKRESVSKSTSEMEKEIAEIKAELARLKEMILQSEGGKTEGDLKLRIENIIGSLTLRRLIEIIKRRYGWESLELRDFHDKKKGNRGFAEIIKQTEPQISDPIERERMRKWAKIFNRYARDGVGVHSEEIESIMEILLELIRGL